MSVYPVVNTYYIQYSGQRVRRSSVLIWECYLFDSLSKNRVFAKEEAGRTLGAALASMKQLCELR